MLKTTIAGHIGSVKLVKKSGKAERGGFTTLNFTVASNTKSASGEIITHWASCKLWGPRAEALAPHLSQGQAVVVEGRPEARAFSGKTSKAQAELVVHVTYFEFTGPRPKGAPKSIEIEVDGNTSPTIG